MTWGQTRPVYCSRHVFRHRADDAVVWVSGLSVKPSDFVEVLDFLCSPPHVYYPEVCVVAKTRSCLDVIPVLDDTVNI